MNTQQSSKDPRSALETSSSWTARFGQWIQDPMGSVIAASVATIGSLGVVMSSIWAIHFALN